MSRSQFSIQRLLGAALILGAASLPAAAQQTPATPAESTPTATATANAMTVTRDADTGMLRAATPQEQAALTAAKSRFAVRMAVPQPETKYHSSGAVGVRLTDEFINANALVATRGADGKVTVAHGNADDHDHAAPVNTRPTNAATE
jgi:hypothetical protein